MEEPLLGRASPADEAEKRRVYRNVLLLSFAFMLHYTAMDGMGNLQSSVNAKGGLGTVAFSSTFLATIACSAFLPPIVIRYETNPTPLVIRHIVHNTSSKTL